MRGGGGERKGGEGLPRLKITSGYALAWTAWVENAAITSRRRACGQCTGQLFVYVYKRCSDKSGTLFSFFTISGKMTDFQNS